MNRLVIIIIILVAATLSGCYYDSEEKLYPVLDTSCNLDSVTFSGTIKPILKGSCYRCHSNANSLNLGGGIKLENHADLQILVNNGRLMGAVTHDGNFQPMPQPNGKLSDCEINQLQIWIDNETPDN